MTAKCLVESVPQDCLDDIYNSGLEPIYIAPDIAAFNGIDKLIEFCKQCDSEDETQATPQGPELEHALSSLEVYVCQPDPRHSRACVYVLMVDREHITFATNSRELMKQHILRYKVPSLGPTTLQSHRSKDAPKWMEVQTMVVGAHLR